MHTPYVVPDRPLGYLSPSEVAQQLQVYRQTVAYWCRHTPGLGIRQDGRWWIAPERLTAFLSLRPPRPAERQRRKAHHAQG